MKRRSTLAPEEGWLTLGLVLLLCLTLAWSVDGARYVLGRDEYLDFLRLAAAGGVLVGFIGPKVGWGRWLTFLIGSIFAALLVPLMAGLLVHPTGASLHTLFQSTSDASIQAYIDIAIRRLPVTTQFLHHALIIGLLDLGDLDVRVVRRLRASADAQRGRRRRRPARRQHVDHVRQPARHPRRVHPRRAPAAHPGARLRGAVRVAAAADRRPGLHRDRVPPGRGRVHRDHRRGGACPDGRRVVRAAGGRLGWRRGRAGRACRRRSRASCRPVA